jgi:membrane protease YdiL (CAAX protease family)
MCAWDLTQRKGLLQAAAIFYLLVAAVAVGLCWLNGVDLAAQLPIGGVSLAIGLAAVVPMLPVLFASEELREIVLETLGRPLSRCRIYELAILATIVGVSEELLFRGALQSWWTQWNPLVGFIGVNILFGLLHAVTPLYGVIAFAFGLYFSWLATVYEPVNLVVPMTAHALYDFIGFVVIGREYRKRMNTALMQLDSGEYPSSGEMPTI